MRLALVFCLAALAAAEAPSPRPNGGGNGGATKNRAKRDDFDFYLFVRQWDPAICDSMRCGVSPKLEDFTIHGLWPNRVDGSWPQYCNDTARFAPKAVDSIRPQLKAAWPSFGDGGDVGFWRHEWLRHGTCAGGDMATNETAYFATALALNDKLPLLPVLKDAGIVPSNTVARPHSVVVAALKKGLGVTPAVHCGSGKGRSKVTEVWVCVDKDGETPIDCPAVIKSKKGPGGSQQGKGACSNITLPTIKGAPGKSGGGGGGQAGNGGGASEPKSGWGGLDGDARG